MKIVVAYSGGKDSTAALLRLLECGIVPDYVIFSYVIGNMLDDVKHRVYRVVRAVDHYFPGVLKRFYIIDGWIEEVGTKYDFVSYIERAGFPIPRCRLWCNDKCKIGPELRFLAQRGIDVSNVVKVLGIRWTERTRSNYLNKLVPIGKIGNFTLWRGTLAKSVYGRKVQYFLLPIYCWNCRRVWLYLRKNYPEVYDALQDMYIRVDSDAVLNLSLCIICPLHSRDVWRAIVMSNIFDIEYILSVLYYALQREKSTVAKRLIQRHIDAVESYLKTIHTPQP